MNHNRYATVALICIAGLALGAALPLPVFASADSLGQHVVQKGETLYCLGRGYGVVPSAIAAANGLSAFAFLRVGQLLSIPAVQWSPIPAGPVCARQFASPFTGGAEVTLTPTPAPPTPPSCDPSYPDVCLLVGIGDYDCAGGLGDGPNYVQGPIRVLPPDQFGLDDDHDGIGCETGGLLYTVRRGDNLFRIALRFGTTAAAIVQANNIPNPDRIYVGQVLVIPSSTITPSPGGCPTGCITPPLGCLIKGNVSIDTGEKIYHVPGGAFYEETIIRPEYGERWFCTEAEAIANGWRKSER